MKELVRAIRSSNSPDLWLQYQDGQGMSEWRQIDIEDLLAKERGKDLGETELWEVKAGLLMSKSGYVVDPSMLYTHSQASEPPKVRFIVDTRPRVLADVADPGIRRLGGEKMSLIRWRLLECADTLLEKETWQVYLKDLDVTVLGVTRANELNGWLVISSILQGEWPESQY